MNATGVNRYFRDARTKMVAEGSSEIYYDIVSSAVLGIPSYVTFDMGIAGAGASGRRETRRPAHSIEPGHPVEQRERKRRRHVAIRDRKAEERMSAAPLPTRRSDARRIPTDQPLGQHGEDPMSRDLIDLREQTAKASCGRRQAQGRGAAGGRTHQRTIGSMAWRRFCGCHQRARPSWEGFDMDNNSSSMPFSAGLPASPVPRVTYYCEDNSIIVGFDFSLWNASREPVFRSTIYRVVHRSARRIPPQDLCRQWVEVIASPSLSHVSPSSKCLGRQVGARDELAFWRGHAERAGADSLVAMIDLGSSRWGRVRVGPACVVHGDPETWQHALEAGRLQAVLDWEMASNGEPLNDLGYMLYFFPSSAHPAQVNCDHAGMWTREQIVSEWERLTGGSAQGSAWYEAAGAAKIAAIIAYGHAPPDRQERRCADGPGWVPVSQAGIATVEMLIESIGRD